MNIERIVKQAFNRVLNENEQKQQYIAHKINSDVEELNRMCQKFMQEQSNTNLGWLLWYCRNFVKKYDK